MPSYTNYMSRNMKSGYYNGPYPTIDGFINNNFASGRTDSRPNMPNNSRPNMPNNPRPNMSNNSNPNIPNNQRNSMANNPRNNMSKFQSNTDRSRTNSQEKSAIDINKEITAWVSKNEDPNVVIESHQDNNIYLSMTLDHKHSIKLTYPKFYPKTMKGFRCCEIPSAGIAPLKFISQVDEKFEDKALTIDRVLTYLAKNFTNHKNSKLQKQSVQLTKPIIQSSTQVLDTVSPVTNNSTMTETDDLFNDGRVITLSTITEKESPLHVTFEPNYDMDSAQPIDDNEMIKLDPDNDVNVSVKSIINDICYHTALAEERAAKSNIEHTNNIDVIDIIGLNNDIQTINSILQTHMPMCDISESETGSSICEPIEYPQCEQSESPQCEPTESPVCTQTESLMCTQIESPICEQTGESQCKQTGLPQCAQADVPQCTQDDVPQCIQSGVPRCTQVDKPQCTQVDEPQCAQADVPQCTQAGVPRCTQVDEPQCIQTDIPQCTQADVPQCIQADEPQCIQVDVPQCTQDTETDSPMSDTIIEEDDRQDTEELFDLGEEFVVRKPQKKVAVTQIVCPNNTLQIQPTPTPTNINILSDLNFDEFVIAQIKLFEQTNPDMDDDEMMDIIQLRWKNELKEIMQLSDSDNVNDTAETKLLSSDNKIKHTESDDSEMSDSDDSEKIPAKKPIGTATKKSSNTSTKKSSKTTGTKSDHQTSQSVQLAQVPPQSVVNNIIDYSDIYDKMGLYQNLEKYTVTSSMPYDIDKLRQNAKLLQNKMEFGDSTKISKSFSSTAAIDVVINEIVHIYGYGQQNNFTIEPIADNIYQLKLLFKSDFFDKTSIIYSNLLSKPNICIEANIEIDSKLYPFYPPKLKLISPRLNNNLNVRIATMDCLLISNWNPMYNIETIITSFRKLMNKYGELDLVAANTTYDILENELIELSLLTEIPARSNSFLDLDTLKNIKTIGQKTDSKFSIGTTTKQYWASGTGYGHSGQASWDIKSTEKALEQRDKQLLRCVSNIKKRVAKIVLNQIPVNIVDIITTSCYIPYLKSVFYKNSILELLKKPGNFESMMDFMRILDNRFVPLFTIKDAVDKENASVSDKVSLHEILAEINAECVSYKKTTKSAKTKSPESKYELNLINNFVAFFDKIDAEIKKIHTNNIIAEADRKRKLTTNELYKKQLADNVCIDNENMDMNAFTNLIKNAQDTITTKFVLNDSARWIAKEILSHTKNLPLDCGSSIFYRYNPNDLRFHEFVIAAPENTPYDSGCFHFRMYCPSRYPEVCPKVNIYTTGNGTVSFNPNLYDDGTVCLSILGTWDGAAGETWMPKKSTMMQVMISIQALVLIPDPYFNEPDDETEYGTARGKTLSKQYNDAVRLNTMKWAILDQIKNPTPSFESAIKTHFKLKAEYIKKNCAMWVDEAPASTKSEYKKVYVNICAELDRLTGSKTVIESKYDTDQKSKSDTDQKSKYGADQKTKFSKSMYKSTKK